MDKENQKLTKRIREILKKKEEENRALLKLIRAVTGEIKVSGEK
jgi:hypothetical protein